MKKKKKKTNKPRSRSASIRLEPSTCFHAACTLCAGSLAMSVDLLWNRKTQKNNAVAKRLATLAQNPNHMVLVLE